MANITPFNGEFLINPFPLEMSVGVCSHGCQYCFATTKPQAEKDTIKEVTSTMRWLGSYHDKESLEAQLMQQGYPVVISNRSDPFSRAGEMAILPIAETMRDMQIPMMIQTKGGRKLLDFAKTLPPSAFYISISFDEAHTKLCRQIEPAAPTPKERLESIKALKAMGHTVYVGWNPCVEEWVEDAFEFACEIKKAGAHGVWLEALHLSKIRLSTLDDKAVNNLGQELIADAMNKKEKPLLNFVAVARQACLRAGLEVFSGSQGVRSNYWNPVRELYEKTLPIWQDVVNWCHDNKPVDPIDPEFFIKGFVKRLPIVSRKAECGHILTSQRWTIGNDPAYSNKMSYEEVLRFGMSDERVVFNPIKNWAFSYAGSVNEEGKAENFYVNEEGKRLFRFVESGKVFDIH